MADCKKYNGSTWGHSLRKLGTATDTITTLPADLYADGQSATVGLVGNMYQASGVSPATPIQPSETGERTGNLFDESTIEVGGLDINTGAEVANSSRRRSGFIKVTPSTTYTLSRVIDETKSNLWVIGYDANKNVISDSAGTLPTVLTSIGANSTVSVFDTTTSTEYIRWYVTANGSYSDIMLNTGSTALPYEPYGYKIPISSANTTTPVYLGEVETTRKIKKLVLTGEEEWLFYSDSISSWQFYINNISLGGVAQSSCVSNIAPYGVTAVNRQRYDYGCYLVTSGSGIAFQMKGAKDTFTGITAWKSYLAAQYANGTPVTVWYVLATEETGIVNEPIRKIGNYADEVSGISIPTITGKDSFDVLTTLKPSEVSLAYTGWHDASAKEWDGSEWQ